MARDIDTLLLGGVKLPEVLNKAIIKAEVSMTTAEVSQLSVTVIDPGWTYLEGTQFQLGTSVVLPVPTALPFPFNFEIASVETGDSSGTENFSVDCRPTVVRKLKDRRGAYVLGNVSPSEFVALETAAVGGAHITEPCARRSQISRDVPQAGAQETQSEPPSSWTTFKRLAREMGFILFEAYGIIHFGRPSWFVNSPLAPVVNARHKTGPEKERMMTVPSARSSRDDPDRTIDFELPSERRFELRTGHRLHVEGIPRFSGDYLLSSVSWDLLEPKRHVSVKGEIPQDPVPSPPE